MNIILNAAGNIKYIFDKKASIMFPSMEELFDKNMDFIEILDLFIEKYIDLLIPLFVSNVFQALLDSSEDFCLNSFNTELSSALFKTASAISPIL